VSVRTFARESIFQHILEIPFKQSGLLGKILLDRASASARYFVMIVISIRNK